jgi:hypothetical protein
MKKIFIFTIILILFFTLINKINAQQIDGADVGTLKTLDQEYSIDKNNVYFRGEPIPGADPESFKRIGLPYSKDKNNVYYFTIIIPGADPNSIVYLNTQYVKDNNNVYYKANVIKNSDSKTFVVLNDYTKDKNNYYQNGNIITEKYILSQIKKEESAEYVNLSNKLKGKILLQVESKGESWYVSPLGKLWYLRTPQDAFTIMKNLGQAMSSREFEKIQVADMNLANGQDSDNDGLSDQIENALGTEKNKKDSDGDSYNDKDEILSGYNPTGNGKLDIDFKFVKGRMGLIYLQVDRHGEAWYINPNDSKRYFLGRPQDAFNVMRNLGLGISNNNLNKLLNYECAAKPTTTTIGRDIYPISSQYKNIQFLGQLFTAFNCGPDRLSKIFGVKGEYYTLGSSIRLTNSYESLINTLKSIGYTCKNNNTEKTCNEWILNTTVKLNELLKLESFYTNFESDDCVNCG